MESKEHEKIKYPKKKFIIAGFMMMLLLCVASIQYTNLMRYFIINYIVNIVISNSLNIIALVIILIVMNILEIGILKKNLNREGQE